MIKIGQAAEIIGVSIKTLQRWDNSGKLPTIRDVNNKRLYREEDIDKYLLDKYKKDDDKITIRLNKTNMLSYVKYLSCELNKLKEGI